jgi:dienelactone hydrolase
MGGTYALQAACNSKACSAAAPFYGDIPDEFTLKGLKCPVFYFGNERPMDKPGKSRRTRKNR